jgi:peptide/nickel transport system substrate-binding protein
LVSDGSPSWLDPGTSYEVIGWRVLHLLGDGLVAFEPIGGTNAALVPDLAASIPTPTDGGRTYTFELREGIRYANGEVVAAADFRRALERGFPLNEFAHEYLYGGLVGGEACISEPETCDLSEGIVTDDATGAITFRLVAPDPEFLYKLTLPFAYPVPASVPDEVQADEGIPGTGPYMLDAPMTSEGLALVRNPHFHVWSPAAQPEGYVDRIEWTFGVEPQAQVKAVADGEADLALDAGASGRFDEILVRFAAQVHTSPAAATYFLVLNSEAAPFNDARVRRAVNFAVDRGKVAQIFGGETAAVPTCQQLPPNFPGYEPFCPYTRDPGPEGSWTAPDFEKAQRLVRRSGTDGMRVVIEWVPGIFPAGLVAYMDDMLDKLGYRGSVSVITQGEFYRSGDEFQAKIEGWASDYAAASNFITNRFTCGAGITPSATFCDPEIDAMIDRATRLQIDEPAVSGRLWAEIDRAIIDQAPYLWLVNPTEVAFVSGRVGNYQQGAQWGVLLNQLWVR